MKWFRNSTFPWTVVKILTSPEVCTPEVMSKALQDACLPSVSPYLRVQCGLPTVTIVLVINNFHIACIMQLGLAEGKMKMNISWWHFNSYPCGSDRSRMPWTSHWFSHPLFSSSLSAQVCQTSFPGLKHWYHALLLTCLLFPWETGISLCIVSLSSFHISDLSHSSSLPSCYCEWEYSYP